VRAVVLVPVPVLALVLVLVRGLTEVGAVS